MWITEPYEAVLARRNEMSSKDTEQTVPAPTSATNEISAKEGALEGPVAKALEVTNFSGLTAECSRLISGEDLEIVVDRRGAYLPLLSPRLVIDVEVKVPASSSSNFTLEFRIAGSKSYKAAKVAINAKSLVFKVGEFIDAIRIRAASLQVWKDQKLNGLTVRSLSKEDLATAVARYKELETLKANLDTSVQQAAAESARQKADFQSLVTEHEAKVAADYKRLEDVRKNQEDEYKAKEAERSALDEKIEKLKERSTTMENEAQEAEEDLNSVRADVEEKQVAVATLSTSLAQLKNELAIKTDELTTRTREVARAKDEHQIIARKTSLYATTLEGHCIRNKRIKREYLTYYIAPVLVLGASALGFAIYGGLQLWNGFIEHHELGALSLAGIKVITGLPILYFTFHFGFQFAAPFVREIRRIDSWESELEAILLVAERTAESLTSGLPDAQKIEAHMIIRGHLLENFLTRHKQDQNRNEIVIGERLEQLVSLLLAALKNPKVEILNLIGKTFGDKGLARADSEQKRMDA